MEQITDTSIDFRVCPVRNVLGRFSDKWSMLVLMGIHGSKTGILRFSDLKRRIPDCSQKMLSQTLKNLERNHLVNRRQYPEVPPRVEYSLTDTGKSLMPPVNALVEWALDHFNDVVGNS